MSYRYFALSITFLLETGFTFVLIKDCEQYFQENGNSLIAIRDQDSKNRYFICMWLW
jgi:hypothetical protein